MPITSGNYPPSDRPMDTTRAVEQTTANPGEHRDMKIAHATIVVYAEDTDAEIIARAHGALRA